MPKKTNKIVFQSKADHPTTSTILRLPRGPLLRMCHGKFTKLGLPAENDVLRQSMQNLRAVNVYTETLWSWLWYMKLTML